MQLANNTPVSAQTPVKTNGSNYNAGETRATVVRATGEAYDGTTVTMNDTPANALLSATHQSKSDVAFRCKMVVWFCVTAGPSWKLRWPRLPRMGTGTATVPPPTDDVVVADSAYGVCGFGFGAFSGADAVFRKHHARHCDFREAKVRHWRSVLWQRPERCPQSMDQWTLHATKHTKRKCIYYSTTGVSSQEIILVTTLVDSNAIQSQTSPTLSTPVASD